MLLLPLNSSKTLCRKQVPTCRPCTTKLKFSPLKNILGHFLGHPICIGTLFCNTNMPKCLCQRVFVSLFVHTYSHKFFVPLPDSVNLEFSCFRIPHPLREVDGIVRVCLIRRQSTDGHVGEVLSGTVEARVGCQLLAGRKLHE